MSLSHFEILEQLGSGAYSIVYKVRRKADNSIYALKKVRILKLKEKEKENALNEIRILASVNHPNIISYKEAFFDDQTSSLWQLLDSLVMEYADNGDLYQKIVQHQKRNSYMSENFIWNVLVQITLGLKALHELNIHHRDIKSANVFLNKDGTVKLGDMNVSKVAKQGFLHTQTGTPYYASPEVWKDKPYNNKSDIWSLGCVIYEAASLRPPFRAQDMKGLYQKVIKGEIARLPRNFSQDLNQLIYSLIRINPDRRPSCQQILSLEIVKQRMQSQNQLNNYEDEDNELLKTIIVTSDMLNIQGQLPEPKYERPNQSEPPPTQQFEDMPSVNKRRKNSTGTGANSIRQPSLKDISESSRKIAGRPKNYRQILREKYGALKLPSIKYPKQQQRSQNPTYLKKESLRRLDPIESQIKNTNEYKGPRIFDASKGHELSYNSGIRNISYQNRSNLSRNRDISYNRNILDKYNDSQRSRLASIRNNVLSSKPQYSSHISNLSGDSSYVRPQWWG